ncbi:MAG TPA: response regulator transcription factor [Kofleriaceae bacterium]|jgi:DNA-binding NarL/FixJ family response regulator|nr:response regulator transcription factor [Kofleriaceae bacterium]
MIRVFIADDHGVLRRGLRALVESQHDMEVVGEAEDGLEAEAGILDACPDVAVLDISMPRRGGIETIVSLKQKRPETRVLVLTVHEDSGFAQAAIAAGASGYIVKSVADTDLLAAVRAVTGGATIGAAALDAVPERRTVRPRDVAMRQLSVREREVLRLIAEGHTNREVADLLGLSIKSVETYRARSMEKLGLRTRAELVRYALELGLLRVR